MPKSSSSHCIVANIHNFQSVVPKVNIQLHTGISCPYPTLASLAESRLCFWVGKTLASGNLKKLIFTTVHTTSTIFSEKYNTYCLLCGTLTLNLMEKLRHVPKVSFVWRNLAEVTKCWWKNCPVSSHQNAGHCH